MGRIERSIEIGGPPEKVWPMVFWDRVQEWFNVIKKVERTSKGKDGLGATAHVVAKAMGIKVEWDAKTIEWKENEKVAWRSTAGNFKMSSSMTFSPTKDGTKVTFVMNYDLPYSVLGKIIDKLGVSREVSKSIDRGMKK